MGQLLYNEEYEAIIGSTRQELGCVGLDQHAQPGQERIRDSSPSAIRPNEVDRNREADNSVTPERAFCITTLLQPLTLLQTAEEQTTAANSGDLGHTQGGWGLKQSTTSKRKRDALLEPGDQSLKKRQRAGDLYCGLES
jgi:hypothetical protein